MSGRGGGASRRAVHTVHVLLLAYNIANITIYGYNAVFGQVTRVIVWAGLALAQRKSHTQKKKKLHGSIFHCSQNKTCIHVLNNPQPFMKWIKKDNFIQIGLIM